MKTYFDFTGTIKYSLLKLNAYHLSQFLITLFFVNFKISTLRCKACYTRQYSKRVRAASAIIDVTALVSAVLR